MDYCDIEWFALETNRDHSVIFEIASKYCISDSFVDYPLHYSGLENSMDHGVAKNQTELSDFIFTFFHFHSNTLVVLLKNILPHLTVIIIVFQGSNYHIIL